jgi:diguanylate cyclase (GGDEF)-like protein
MTVESWDETFQELQRTYLVGAQERMEQLYRELDALAHHPGDAGVLAKIRACFHGFAGSGGTFGFAAVSEAGSEGEETCDRILRERSDSPPSDLSALRRVAGVLRAALGPREEEVASPAEPASPSAGPRGEAVVLDEDPAFRVSLSGLLEREGLSVRAFGTVSEARAALVDRTPDLLVTAITLPDGPGASVIESLREQPRGQSAFVAVVGSGTGFLDKVEVVTSGADLFVEKPVDLDAFARQLRLALEPRETETPRILSVEDDPYHAGFIRAVLEPAGFEVRNVADPSRLEVEAASFRPDLFLMDVNLPGARGYDVVRFLRRDPRFATLPVIFLTVEGRDQARIASLRAGGDDHLVKPVAPGLLVSTVAARLERARLLKGLLVRDGLTGLLTHTAFLERARAAAAAAERRPGRPVTLVILDLDHFKEVNDVWGHPVGDRVLAALGLFLRRRLRASDTIGRIGGDEFALLFEELSGDDTLRLVRRLLSEFESLEHRSDDGQVFHCSFSAGIALLEAAAMTLESWRRTADGALYEAKAAGRHRVELARRTAGGAVRRGNE